MVKMFGEELRNGNPTFTKLVEFSGNDVHFGAREGMRLGGWRYGLFLHS
jgi:hypothetical protein